LVHQPLQRVQRGLCGLGGCHAAPHPKHGARVAVRVFRELGGIECLRGTHRQVRVRELEPRQRPPRAESRDAQRAQPRRQLHENIGHSAAPGVLFRCGTRCGH
jgi:hypothetical protein